MASTRSLDERISELQDRQKQLKAQEKALKAKRSQENRKKEAHRKIVVGGAVESVLGRPVEEDEIGNLIFFLQQQDERGGYFSNFMNRGKGEGIQNGEYTTE